MSYHQSCRGGINRTRSRPAACLTLFILIGCSGERLLYEVHGRVSCEGAGVEDGTIMFLNTTTQYADQAPLGEGGTYSLKLPPGSYKIVIEPVLVKAGGPKGPEDWAYKKAQNIPKKYRQAETTDLAADVADDATVDFDMTPSPQG